MIYIILYIWLGLGLASIVITYIVAYKNKSPQIKNYSLFFKFGLLCLIGGLITFIMVVQETIKECRKHKRIYQHM